MPTLRRSKSLNDKLTRQKSRTGDIIRDPRSPDVEGRTRQNVDNFQALLHVKKQTEDRARQLDLALSYAANGGITSPRSRGPAGGVELPYPGAGAFSTLSESPEGDIDIDAPVQYRRRQRSADGRPGGSDAPRPESGVMRQQQLLHKELQQRQQQQQQRHQHQHQHQHSLGSGQLRSSQRQQQRAPRPMSMIEPRLVQNLIPSQEELARKDQVIQSLTDSQRNLSKQNHALLSKIDELEFQVSQLKEVVRTHNMSSEGTLPRRGVGLSHERDLVRGDEAVDHAPMSLQGDVTRREGEQPSNAASPSSEHSVSGYGSLSGSACDGGALPSRDGGVRVERVTDGYDEESLRLSVCSQVGQDSRANTLAGSSSSGDSVPRIRTMSRDSDSETHQDKGDHCHSHSERDGRASGSRIQELERRLGEVTGQRDSILQRYKHLVDVNQQLMKRDEQIEMDLRALLSRHGKVLQPQIKTELRLQQERLCDLGHDIRSKLDAVLKALSPQDSQRGRHRHMEKDVGTTLDRMVDLIGPDYLKLGRRLGVPQQDLEKIESSRDNVAGRTRGVLESWLGGRSGMPHNPAHELGTALRDIDKDVHLLKQTPISGPERQALRSCLQFALDHVTDPLSVLDHLIILNELTPGGIAFVQEVRPFPHRVLCRLWHIAEYRNTGIVSKLALALQNSSLPHVARKLTDELEVQNIRLHSRSHTAVSVQSSLPQTAQGHSQLPRPSHSQGQGQKSRPVTRLPRPRSKILESYIIPETEKADVWSKQSENSSPSKTGRQTKVAMLENNRISEV